MAGVDNDQVHIIAHVLLQQRIHKKALASPAGSQHEFVTVADPASLHRQVRRIDGNGDSLPVRKLNQKVRGLASGQRLLKKQTECRGTGGQKPIVVF